MTICPEARLTRSTAPASTSRFDLVIRELVVPGYMGGVAAPAQLKALDPNVRAIVCSGYSNDPSVTDYGTLGYCAKLNKPFRIDELEAICAEVAGLGQSGKGELV